jgi:hypothetical protein
MAQATEQNTIKSTHESITDDSRGRSTVTRRLAMNMFVGTAIAGAAIASQSAAAADDPIFAAIEAHKAARATWIEWVYRHSDLEEELPQEKCKSWADMYEEKIFEMDDPRWIECERAVVRTMNAEIDAAVVLVDVRPTTQAGICALLQYAHASDTDGEAWPRELQSDDGKITRPWEYFLIESVAGALAKLSTAGTV